MHKRRPSRRDAKAISRWAPTDTVKLASQGNTEAARDILRTFFEAVQLTNERDWPAQIPWPFVQYVAEAFRKITQRDTEAGPALGLKASKAGRPPGLRTHDPVRLAAAYWLLRRHGRTAEKSNELIRAATGADRTTIQAAAKRYSIFKDPARIAADILTAITSESPALAKAKLLE